jgi:hypothetical protein
MNLPEQRLNLTNVQTLMVDNTQFTIVGEKMMRLCRSC